MEGDRLCAWRVGRRGFEEIRSSVRVIRDLSAIASSAVRCLYSFVSRLCLSSESSLFSSLSLCFYLSSLSSSLKAPFLSLSAVVFPLSLVRPLPITSRCNFQLTRIRFFPRSRL